LDKIEKKMDKETESSKSRSHRSHDKIRETKSVDRHHHHSPSNSVRREHGSSSPSSVRKHKKRYGVDEIQGEMNKIKPLTFDGENADFRWSLNQRPKIGPQPYARYLCFIKIWSLRPSFSSIL
jgi:hypothetical protein